MEAVELASPSFAPSSSATRNSWRESLKVIRVSEITMFDARSVSQLRAISVAIRGRWLCDSYRDQNRSRSVVSSEDRLSDQPPSMITSARHKLFLVVTDGPKTDAPSKARTEHSRT